LALQRVVDWLSQAVGGEFETRIPLQKRLEWCDVSPFQGVFFLPGWFSWQAGQKPTCFWGFSLTNGDFSAKML